MKGMTPERSIAEEVFGAESGKHHGGNGHADNGHAAETGEAAP